jgi:hypothetical protein
MQSYRKDKNRMEMILMTTIADHPDMADPVFRT